MDHHADWFLWTAGVDLALPNTPENARIRRAIGPDKARRVLIVLASHADVSGHAWPSIPTIVDRANLGRRTVADGLVYLLAAGVIEKAGKVGRAVRYRLIKGRGLPDTSTPKKDRGLPDTSTGEVSGDVSGELSGPARPEQEQEQNHPPTPRNVPADLAAALRGEGVLAAEDMRAVIAISQSDPETKVSATGRLLNAPIHRQQCIETFRTERRLARDAERATAPRCTTCSLPVGECDRANDRNPGWCDGPDARAEEAIR